MTHSTDTRSVLFLCVANSARSQLAEGLTRALLGPEVRALSAGSRPTHLHPCAVAVMAEVGVDISAQASKPVASVDPRGVDLVVTLCAEEVCPAALIARAAGGDGGEGVRARRLHWPLPDPAREQEGDGDEERLARFRATRDALRALVLTLPAELRGAEGR